MKIADLKIADRDPVKRILRVAWKALVWLFGLFVVAAIAVATWIWYGERERESLIRSYEMPTFYLNALSVIEGVRPMGALMSDDEVVMCLLQQRTFGNLIVGGIKALSIAQTDAARNALLPSPDSDGRYWYILFFKEKTISRIYLVDDHKLDFDLANAASSCADRSMQFVVEKKHSQDGIKNLLIKFHKGD
ncbi:MAG: hypothetical protein RL211_601 [Pseudomonadota bacterium]